MLDNFNEIKVESTSDKIISQIRNLISSGQLNPGDKLPPERKLAEVFGVGRTFVRDAIKKLEFYGIVKTQPQSGTIIAGLGITALEGLITDVLDLEDADFKSLVETRVVLELEATYYAAERRTNEDLLALNKALDAYEKKLKENETAMEEDLLFHLKIAEASKNKVLKSLMLVITPDILRSYADLKVCSKETNNKTIRQHRNILKYISSQDPKKARKAMQTHLSPVLDLSLSK
ncbi:MAG: FadR/GntR family transcriptional regulator [Bacteroidota bacterium]